MTDRLTLTRAADRKRIASIIAEELAKVPGAVVTTTPEGANGGYGPKRRTVRAEVDGVAVSIDCDGALPDFILSSFFFTTDSRTDGRTFAASFACQRSGLPVHGRKASGPMASANRIGFKNERHAFNARDVRTFAVNVWRDLQDVADGGAFADKSLARRWRDALEACQADNPGYHQLPRERQEAAFAAAWEAAA